MVTCIDAIPPVLCPFPRDADDDGSERPKETLQMLGARSRTRTDDPFLTIDPEARKGRSPPYTRDPRLPRKAAAFVEWLSAGGDRVCTS